MPSVDFFLSESDSQLQRKLKKLFYCKAEKSLHKWKFIDELVKSLNSQVNILSQGCLTFLKLSFEFQLKIKAYLGQFDDCFIHPFGNKTISISGYTFRLCKFFFLKHVHMRAVNFEYTGGSGNVSRQEIEFAAFKSHMEPHNEWQHAMNHPEGQKTFGKHKVDLYSPKLKEVLQFHGCQFHCHLPPDCLINTGKSLSDFNRFKTSFESLKLKDESVKNDLLQNYSQEVETYNVQFECLWKKEREGLDFKIFTFTGDEASYNRPTHRLIPRACVRGGLLDVYYLRWKKSLFPNEIFKYADVNSLYPFCAINFPYPVGEYKTLIGPGLSMYVEIKDGAFFYKSEKLVCGSAHVQVRAPKNLKRPFLQYRIFNKLNFLSLCLKCSKNKEKKCRHSNCILESCWMLSDLIMAVKLGYEILAWYEIHYYPETEFILRAYSEILYSEKLKHSGWPNGLDSPEDKQSYCDFINNRMNLPELFRLTLDNVANNPAQRQLAKTMMNNLYGKFSEKIRSKVTEFVRCREALERIAGKHSIHSIIDIRDDDLLQVEYENPLFSSNRNTNIYIGAQINSYARCVMYEHMSKLDRAGANIYSIDTDGIFYSIHQDLDDPLPYSNLCGDFKNMVENSEIMSFFTLGPRNYSLLYVDKEKKMQSILKVKGLVKHSIFREHINHEIFEDFLDSHFESELKSIIIPQMKFCIDKNTKNFAKRFQNFTFHNALYLKRFVQPDSWTTNPRIETLPFGYTQAPKRKNKQIASDVSFLAKKAKRSN